VSRLGSSDVPALEAVASEVRKALASLDPAAVTDSSSVLGGRIWVDLGGFRSQVRISKNRRGYLEIWHGSIEGRVMAFPRTDLDGVTRVVASALEACRRSVTKAEEDRGARQAFRDASMFLAVEGVTPGAELEASGFRLRVRARYGGGIRVHLSVPGTEAGRRAATAAAKAIYRIAIAAAREDFDAGGDGADGPRAAGHGSVPGDGG
jgi:hypothetical protein